MCDVPEAGFVVQNVIAQAAVLALLPPTHEMPYPVLLKLGFAMTLASFGSFPLMAWPLEAAIPFPASGNHWASAPVCGPYFASEKLASLSRFGPSRATQPIIGMVISGSAPLDLDLAMKLSTESPGVALLSGTLSKNQSAARLLAFACQL